MGSNIFLWYDSSKIYYIRSLSALCELSLIDGNICACTQHAAQSQHSQHVSFAWNLPSYRAMLHKNVICAGTNIKIVTVKYTDAWHHSSVMHICLIGWQKNSLTFGEIMLISCYQVAWQPSENWDCHCKTVKKYTDTWTPVKLWLVFALGPSSFKQIGYYVVICELWGSVRQHLWRAPLERARLPVSPWFQALCYATITSCWLHL